MIDSAVTSNNSPVGNWRRPVSAMTGASRFGFWAITLYVFLKASMVHELLGGRFGVQAKLVGFSITASLLFALVSGRWVQGLTGRASHVWLLFGAWAMLSGAFGLWPGGSLKFLFLTYLPTTFVICPLLVSLIADLRSSRRVMLAMAWGGCGFIAISELLPAIAGGRLALGLTGGSVSNSVDLGVHLLFLSGFILYAATETRSWFVRIVLIAIVLLAVHLSLQTGSRTALVGVVAAIPLLLWRAQVRRLLMTAVVGPIVLLVALATLPGDVANRLTAFESGSGTEASGSMDHRTELAKRGIGYAFEHPLFGIGFAMFTDFDSSTAISQGQRATWKGAHNSFVAVASETGLVGFALFITPLFIVLKRLAWLHKLARARPDTEWVAEVARYQFIIILCHCVVICFVNFQYMFYLPMMIGLGIATVNAAQRELPALSTTKSSTKARSAGNQGTLNHGRPGYVSSGVAT